MTGHFHKLSGSSMTQGWLSYFALLQCGEKNRPSQLLVEGLSSPGKSQILGKRYLQGVLIFNFLYDNLVCIFLPCSYLFSEGLMYLLRVKVILY